MAEQTIDIIYRFLADVKQFDKQVKEVQGDLVDSLKKPSAEKLEKELRGVSNELNRLTKLNRITKEEAAKIKKEYTAAKKELRELLALLEGRKATWQTVDRARKQQAAGGAGIPGFTAGTPADMEEYMRQVDAQFNNTEKKTKRVKKSLNESEAAVRKFGAEFAMGMHKGGNAADKAATQVNKVETEIKQVTNEAKKGRATLEELGRALMVKGFSYYGLRMTGASIAQQGQMIGLIGGALAGGVFKAAKDYIDKAESASEVTRNWANEMGRIENAGNRIGKVLAEQSIPLLQKGADLLEKLATFLERNPEAASAALKTGLVLTGIGAIVMAVGKGITLVSDVAFVIAAVKMAASGRDNIIASGVFAHSTKMFAAAVATQAATQKSSMLMAASELGKGKGVAGLFSGAGLLKLALPAIGIILGSIVGDRMFDAIEKKANPESKGWEMKDYGTTFKKLLALMAYSAGEQTMGFDKNRERGLRWMGTVAKWLGLVDEEARKVSDGLEGLSDALRNSLKRDEILEAYEDYKADDLALIEKHMKDRKKVIADALEAEKKANAKFAEDVRKVYEDERKSLANAYKDYKKGEDKNERQYQEQRANVLREGNEAIVKIEEDLQEKLRKLRQEHEDRELELLRARDAVGLIKERQRFLREQTELQRDTGKEIVQRRQDTAQRLQELQIQHEQEKAERLAAYKERVGEIQAQAKERLAELRNQHEQEMREIQVNRNERLRELDLQLIEERRHRLQAFIQQVRDLDASLIGESQIRKQRQAEMLKELDAFLIKYNQGLLKIQQATAVGSKQVGGYVQDGLYKLHNNEFVLNPYTTRALEQLMGGQLTQSGVLAMATGGGRTSITLNDSRRFDSSLRPSDRRMIQQDTVNMMDMLVSRVKVN